MAKFLMRTLEITTKVGCPMNCFYCPQDKLNEAYKIPRMSQIYTLSFDDFKRAISDLPKDIRIDFSGMCEPFLNNHTTDMILYAYNKEYKVSVFTTAIGINEKDIDRLKHIPFETFELHLQDKQGYSHIPQTDYLSFILLEIKKKFKNVVTGDLSKVKIVSRAGNLESIYNQYKKGPLVCSRGLERFVLFPNGQVYLCCMDYSLDHYIGNLFVSTYSYITDGTSPQSFNTVKTLLDSEEGKIICRRCEFADNKN